MSDLLGRRRFLYTMSAPALAFRTIGLTAWRLTSREPTNTENGIVKCLLLAKGIYE
ncbi:MAG TPA: hypothetical protein VFH91_08905 [Pyrinomonadaceae bacterium]|nr:hypothetical protein [Pyrinomonadaceae bacterium]